ncbi:MAG TPA: hypothetical protein VGE69_11045 [Pseudomonadales bacterium]
MTRRCSVLALSFATAAVLGGCGGNESDTAGTSAPQQAAPAQQAPVATAATAANTSLQNTNAADCTAEQGLDYICGIVNGEDILRVSTPWLLVSGMNGDLGGDTSIDGKLHLVNPEDRSWEVLFPGDSPVLEHDTEMFASCPGPLDVDNFSAHGLALKAVGGQAEQYWLYMTSHGAREAIEVFVIDAITAKPTIKWVGCVPMPDTSWTNSLVILKDGGFRATQFMDPTGSGMEGVIAKEITGHVFEWHPGGDVTVIAGTELSGPNGIAMSDDERYIYVAAFGTQEVVRFDLGVTPIVKDSIAVGIAPDNVRWSSSGTLYTAGGNITEGCGGPDCGAGWSVWEIDPMQLTAQQIVAAPDGVALQGVSTALDVGDEIWVGTYGGDRIAIVPKP